MTVVQETDPGLDELDPFADFLPYNLAKQLGTSASTEVSLQQDWEHHTSGPQMD